MPRLHKVQPDSKFAEAVAEMEKAAVSLLLAQTAFGYMHHEIADDVVKLRNRLNLLIKKVKPNVPSRS